MTTTLPLPTFRRAVALAALCMACVAAAPGHAAEVRYYGRDKVPDPAVVAGILGKHPSGRLKMRGADHRLFDEPAAAMAPPDSGTVYRDDMAAREQTLTATAQSAVQQWETQVRGGATARTAVASPATPAPASSTFRAASTAAPRDTSALALAVNFANDSAQLQPDSLPALDAVAQGMQLVGFARPFLIEGHTSAVGSPAYNLRLSRLRAESVKRYLVQHGIPARALRTAGLGQRKPLNPAAPAAPENRRVQFRAL